jgi:hypothetical protein
MEIPMSRKQELDPGSGNRGKRFGTVERVAGSLAVILAAIFRFPWWW